MRARTAEARCAGRGSQGGFCFAQGIMSVDHATDRKNRKPRCTLQRGFLNNGGLSEGIDERFGVGRIGEIVCAVILDEHYLEPGVKLCDI